LVLSKRGDGRRDGCERHPDRECDEGATGEPEAAIDQAHGDGGDGRQIGTDRHRADDEEPVEVDHPVARDHARCQHEREIARDRPRVAGGHAEHVLPDKARLATRRSQPAKDLDARQRDVGIRHAEPAQLLQQFVHGSRVDGRQYHRITGARRVGEPHTRDVVVSVEPARERRHRLRLAVDFEPDHRRSLTRST
jgi:hypothetical protein